MGDEPYAALLPWMVFAVVDRAQAAARSGPASARSITAVDAARDEHAAEPAGAT